MAEPVPDSNTAEIAANGPVNLRGDIAVVSGAGDVLQEATRTSLCRCGASKNRPFCDGTHKKTGSAPSSCSTRKS